jgi:hypothetical protein
VFFWSEGMVSCFECKGHGIAEGATAELPDWLPETVVLAPNLRAQVVVSKEPPARFGNVSGGVGCLSVLSGEDGKPDAAIWIQEDLSSANRHQVLLHEMMHAADIARRQSGEYAARPSEAGYVRPMNHRILSDMSRCLLPMLVASGLWFGVSAKALRQSMSEEPTDVE